MTSLYEQLDRIQRLVLRNFVEYPDSEEHWQMPPADYNGQQRLRDDCDGFCLACRHLLRQEKIPSRLVYCEIPSGGHLVVEVNGWILDNRQDHVVANRALRNYRWKRISGFEAGAPWREISALQAAG